MKWHAYLLMGNFMIGVLFANADVRIAQKRPLCISLGGACAPALNLRNLKLRFDAYPFDWILSPFEGLCKALEEDFQNFLTDLTIRSEGNGVIDHYGFHFTHDWPTVNNQKIEDLYKVLYIGDLRTMPLASNWADTIAAVKEKYQRRIDRFRAACRGSEKVFFIRAERFSQEEAIRLRDLLMKKYPLLDFVLIAIDNTPSFATAWNLDRISNFRVDRWDDYRAYGNGLNQVSSDFELLVRSFNDLEPVDVVE
jgi:hypothetical protein